MIMAGADESMLPLEVRPDSPGESGVRPRDPFLPMRGHCDPMDCSLPGSSIHGIFQARVLEWVAFPFSRGSSQPKDRIEDGKKRISGSHSRLPRGVRPHLEGKQRTALSSRAATQISWSPLIGLKGWLNTSFKIPQTVSQGEERRHRKMF